jgi:hypothetical protein
VPRFLSHGLRYRNRLWLSHKSGAPVELWVKSSREVDRDAGAAEVDEGDQGVGGVKAEGAMADEADLAVKAFEAAVGEAEADRGEDAVAVLAQGAREPNERLEPRARCPCEPGAEVRRRERWVGQVVEQPQLFSEQEGAVEVAVGLLDFPEGRELADGLVLGGLEQ